MIRKYKHRHNIPQVKGYVITHIVPMSDGFLVEYLKIPEEWNK